MTLPRETTGIGAVRITTNVRVEGQRQDELAAEPARRCRARGHDPAHFPGNRGAHHWGASRQPAACRSAADCDTRPHDDASAHTECDAATADADAPARATNS